MTLLFIQLDILRFPNYNQTITLESPIMMVLRFCAFLTFMTHLSISSFNISIIAHAAA